MQSWIGARGSISPSTVAALEAAVASLSTRHVQVRFEEGEGVICNNVLHRRAAFTDGEDARRLTLRIRSFDPVLSE